MTSRYVVNCSMLFADLPLLRRPEAARDAGFDSVEFWWPFESAVPTDTEVQAFVRAVQDAGVQLAALNLAGGDMTAGERGLASIPDRRNMFRDNADIAFGIAEQLGVGALNTLYGNRQSDISAAAQDEMATENLAHVAEMAERIGAVILIEPLSGIEAYPLRTAAHAVAVIDRVGLPAMRLLADLYHLSVNGDDIAAVIATFGDRIGHVQIADDPGRAEPGTGTIDFDGLLAQLFARGYRGHVSLEYRPTAPDPFGWLPRDRRGGSPWDQSAARSNS
ncbi:hydroxypyruvate isomerase [Arthrobacter sp. SLBN-53]|nr:hydroxypyruvate isomerase [Arthrobacter sp. SLBN-53]